ncbi:CDP-glycerol glycerophosphotransferase family protein [Pseudomonas nitroreducens]|uniref:CDP-glycerol glycerophosphotransferase family protein n=1 Tax=Pseudomonas nitroreducens TaxID=46680 RepID=UPI002658F5D5|nr:CDP-glycerol glycerophosphotransferase family protein [Pseudomonas nitroreducens]MCP1647231.1 CDP-glycerol glycerophosphotransferase (TagB/SpsB family) [Pseudomonas nitroreducens]MCP1685807.1 CDP-glycerol glycerophosphotransferase (TagB/SpsB family) [Pseudomonas nitroreducens]
MNSLKKILKLLFDASTTAILSPVYFLSGLVSRDPKKIVFGCHLKHPAGNIFSFYKHCLEANDGKKMLWIAANEETYQKLKEENLPTLRKNSIHGIHACLTAQFFCYSSYISDINFTLSRNAKPINLWHGTPLKKIEADIKTGIYSIRYKHPKTFTLIQPWIFVRPYKVLVSSDYESNCFKTAFKITDTQLYRSFPPRLIGLTPKTKQDENNKKILLAPTFRDGSNTKYENLVNLEKINNYCRKNKITITIKAHPSDKSFDNLNLENLSNINISDKLTNIYTLLPKADLVITDYSSIFFDCHYLSIPFILHWPDLEFYTKNCREFYFSPETDLFESITNNDDDLIKKISESFKTHNTSKLNFFKQYELAEDYPLGIFREENPTTTRQE